MRVLVTGHRGYLGSVMTAVLQHARFEVVGLDCDLYDGCDFGRVQHSIPSFDTGLRDIEFTDLLSFDAVVHLAELPEDYTGRLDAAMIEETNHGATLHLAECCKEAGVSRFLFSSSCSVYGRGDHKLLDECDSVRPLSAYAASKLRCEQDLARLADPRPGGFSPVFLRNATAYGVSPRLRLDLPVNDLVGSAVATGCVMLRTIGSAWQPLIHIEDVARTYAAMLVAPNQAVSNEVFNVARSDENYRAIHVANAVTGLFPDYGQYMARGLFDTHSRRVDGTKLARTLPKLALHWTLPVGIRQLFNAMRASGLTPAQWRSDRYRRVLRLAKVIEGDQLPEKRSTIDLAEYPGCRASLNTGSFVSRKLIGQVSGAWGPDR